MEELGFESRDSVLSTHLSTLPKLLKLHVSGLCDPVFGLALGTAGQRSQELSCACSQVWVGASRTK